MCIVPLSDEHAKYFELLLKQIEHISAFSLPLLNSFKYSPFIVEKILIIVPLITKNNTLSDAVAIRFPSLFRDKKLMLDSWLHRVVKIFLSSIKLRDYHMILQ